MNRAVAHLAGGELRGCGRLHCALATDRQFETGLAGVPAGAGPRLGRAGARIFLRRPLEQARRHARTHGLWLARRLHRRHRDWRHHRIVAHDADLCRALAGVFAAAAGLGDHSGCDRHARIDAGDGAVRDRLRRDLADHAGDHPWLCGGRAPALRGGAVAADVAARGDLQRSRCPPPAPTFSPACASA